MQGGCKVFALGSAAEGQQQPQEHVHADRSGDVCTLLCHPSTTCKASNPVYKQAGCCHQEDCRPPAAARTTISLSRRRRPMLGAGAESSPWASPPARSAAQACCAAGPQRPAQCLGHGCSCEQSSQAVMPLNARPCIMLSRPVTPLQREATNDVWCTLTSPQPHSPAQ